MSEFQYLAAIGKRGGLVSRRELTKSHARQNGGDPRDEACCPESRKTLASARSPDAQAFLTPFFIRIVSGL